MDVLTRCFFQDRDGFMFFRDRADDAFCWKGNDLYTTEVAEGVIEYHQIQVNFSTIEPHCEAIRIQAL